MEILIRIPEHADKLAPLVIAVRLEADQTVRAPNEVLETAADIRNEIKELRKELKEKRAE